MKKLKERLLSLTLAVSMVLSMLPITAQATASLTSNIAHDESTGTLSGSIVISGVTDQSATNVTVAVLPNFAPAGLASSNTVNIVQSAPGNYLTTKNKDASAWESAGLYPYALYYFENVDAENGATLTLSNAVDKKESNGSLNAKFLTAESIAATQLPPETSAGNVSDGYNYKILVYIAGNGQIAATADLKVGGTATPKLAITTKVDGSKSSDGIDKVQLVAGGSTIDLTGSGGEYTTSETLTAGTNYSVYVNGADTGETVSTTDLTKTVDLYSLTVKSERAATSTITLTYPNGAGSASQKGDSTTPASITKAFPGGAEVGIVFTKANADLFVGWSVTPENAATIAAPGNASTSVTTTATAATVIAGAKTMTSSRGQVGISILVDSVKQTAVRSEISSMTLVPVAGSATTASYPLVWHDGNARYQINSLNPPLRNVTYEIYVNGQPTGENIAIPNSADIALKDLNFYTLTLRKASTSAAGQIKYTMWGETKTTASTTGVSGIYTKGATGQLALGVKGSTVGFDHWEVVSGTLEGTFDTTDENAAFTMGTTPVIIEGTLVSNTTYTATVTLNKNNAAWTDNSTYKLYLYKSGTQVKELNKSSGADYTASVATGEYDIYVDNGSGTATATGTKVRVTSSGGAATLKYYDLTVEANPSAGATSVTGSGTYLAGTAVTIGYTPAANYSYQGHTVASGTYDDSAKTYTSVATPTGAITLTLNFTVNNYTATVNIHKHNAAWTGCTYNVALQESSGSTSTAMSGTNGVYTLDVAPGTYKILVNSVDTGKTITITNAAASTTLNYYELTVQANPSAGATSVTGSGTYLAGTAVTIGYTPATNYSYQGYTVASGTYDDSAKTYTSVATPTAAVTLTLNFKQGTQEVTVTLKKNNLVWTDSGLNLYLGTSSSSKTQLTEAGGIYTGSFAPGNYNVYADGTDTGVDVTVASSAVSTDVNYYTVTLAANPAGSATFSGFTSGTACLAGSTISGITATKAANYEPASTVWTTSDGGTISAANATTTDYTLPASADNDGITLTANFTAYPALTASGTSETSIPAGYNTSTSLLTDGKVVNTGAADVANGKLKVKITETNNYSVAEATSPNITVTLGADGLTAGDATGTTITVTPANTSVVPGGKFEYYIWVYDEATGRHSDSIHINASVASASALTLNPDSITWDVFNDKASTADSDHTINWGDYSQITSVALNGSTPLTQGTDWSVSGNVLTIENAWLKKLTTANNGSTLVVTATNAGGNLTTTKAIKLNVTDSMPTIASVTLKQSSGLRVGDTVEINTVTTSDGTTLTMPADAGKVSIKWQLNGEDIAGQTGTTLPITPGMSGKVITAVVSGNGTDYKTTPAKTASTAAIGAQQYTVKATTTVNGATPDSVYVGSFTTTPDDTTGTPATTAEGTKVSTKVADEVKGFKFKQWSIQTTDPAGGGYFGSSTGNTTSTSTEDTFHPTTDTTVVAEYIAIPVLEWVQGKLKTDTAGTEGQLTSEVTLEHVAKNVGKAKATKIQCSLTGITTGDFTVSTDLASVSDELAVDGEVTVQVKPKADLARGTYNGTLVLEYMEEAGNGTTIPDTIKRIQQSFTYTVNAPKYIVTIGTLPDGISGITVDGTSKAAGDTVEVTDPDSITLKATLTDSAKYVFGGWTISDSGTGSFGADDNLTSTFKPTSDVTITAKTVGQPVLTTSNEQKDQSAQAHLIDTSTNIYSFDVQNTGPEDATDVTWAIYGPDGTTDSTYFEFDSSFTEPDTLASEANATSVPVRVKSGALPLTEGTYQGYVVISYKKLAADGATKVDDSKTMPFTFTVKAPEYTVTVDATDGVTVTSDSPAYTAIQLINGVTVTRPGALGLKATLDANKYRFDNWSIKVGGGSAGTFTPNDTGLTTTFTPAADATIKANVTPITTLSENTTTNNQTVDKTALDSSTVAYQTTLTNIGKAASGDVTVKVYDVDASGNVSGSESTKFTVTSSKITALAENRTADVVIKPSTSLTAGSYDFKIVISYSDMAATDPANKEITLSGKFTVTENYFDATVTVKIDNAEVDNATVTLTPTTGQAVTLTHDASYGSGVYKNANATDLDSKKTYTLTVKPNGSSTAIDAGTINAGDNTKTVELYTVTTSAVGLLSGTATVTGAGTYLKGTKVTPTAVAPSGYDFVNWTGTAGGTSITPSTSNTYSIDSIDKAYVLTANFKPYYYLAYSLNGAPGAGTSLPAATKYSAGDAVTAAVAQSWDGYTFGGWNTASGGSGKAVAAEATGNYDATMLGTLPNPGGTVTLYAQWTAVSLTYSPTAAQDLERGKYSVLYNGTVACATTGDGDTSTVSYKPISVIGDTGLPAGVTLAPDGTLSGQPQEAGNFTFTVEASDSRNGQTATHQWTLVVDKWDPTFTYKEIIPDSSDDHLNAAGLSATITAPYYDTATKKWTTYTDTLYQKPSGMDVGDGELSITAPTDNPELSDTPIECTMQYEPANSKKSIYNTVTTEVDASKNGATVVDGPSLSANPVILNFNSQKVGYSTQQEISVTITSNGGISAGTLDYAFGKTDSDAKFEIVGDPDTTTEMEPNATVTFKVRPLTGLPIGGHSDTLTVTSTSGKSVTLLLQFEVTEPTSFDVTVGTYLTGVSAARAKSDQARTIAMRPTGVADDSTDIAGYKTGTGTYTWAETNSTPNALNYNTTYYLVLDDEVTDITVNRSSGSTVAVEFYELALAASGPSAAPDLTGAGNYRAGTSADVSVDDASGYRFTEWKNSSNSSVSSSQAFSYTVNGAATLTAYFEAVYTVSFTENSGTWKDAERPVPYNGTEFAADEMVFIPASGLTGGYTLTRTGYTFQGWATVNNATSGYYAVAVNDLIEAYKTAHSGSAPAAGTALPLYAVWAVKEAGGGLQNGAVTGTYGTALPTGNDAFEVTPPSGEGTYKYEAVAGADTAHSLPTGVTLREDGVFTGTPGASGTFEVTVKATNQANSTELTATYTVTISPAELAVDPAIDDETGNVGDTIPLNDITNGHTVYRDGDDTHTPVPGSWKVDGGSGPVTVTAGETTHKLVYTPNDTINYKPLEVEFTVTGSYQKITALDAAVTKPAASGTPDTTATITGVKDGDSDNVTTATAIGSTKVTWEPADSPFAAGKDYTATIYVKPAAGWQFDTTVNDSAWTATTATGTDSAKLNVITVTSDLLILQLRYEAAQKITSVAVTTSKPMAGDYTTTLSMGQTTYIEKPGSVEWKDAEGNKVTAGNTFVNGGSYTLTVTLIPTKSTDTFDTSVLTQTADYNSEHATVNTNKAKVVDVSATEVTIEYGPFPISALTTVGVKIAEGELTTTVYYAKTANHTTHTGTTGHRFNDTTPVPFAWSTANNIKYKFHMGDGSYSEAVSLDLANSKWKLVYGTSPASVAEMPAADYEFGSTAGDVEKYHGKYVYVQYSDGIDTFVAPEPVGILTVQELKASSIAPSTYDVKLSYLAGEKFQAKNTITADVDFNTGTEGLFNTATGIIGPNDDAADQTKYYYQVQTGDNAYTTLVAGASGSDIVAGYNGKGLYICYTDINDNTVRAFMGLLTVAAESSAGVAIWKETAPVDDDTNPAEYGDTLTANVTPDAHDPITGALSYQWQIEDGRGGWTNIGGATESTYVPVGTDIGKQIKVVVKEEGKSGTVESAPVTVQKRSLTFTVSVQNKYYDETADNKHTYVSGDFTLNNVINNDAVTMSTTGDFAAPNYQTDGSESAAVGSTITWPAVTAENIAAGTAIYALSGGNAGYYRLKTQSAIEGCGEILSNVVTNIKLDTEKLPEKGGTPAENTDDDKQIDKVVPADPFTPGNDVKWEYKDPTSGEWKEAEPDDGLDENGKFLPDSDYRVVVPVEPNTGAEISEDATGSIKVDGVEYQGTYDPEKGTLTVVFPKTSGSSEVSHIEVFFQNAPVNGASIPAAPTDVTDPRQNKPGEGGSTYTATWYYSDTKPANFAGKGTEDTDGTFDPNKYYTVAVQVTAEEGYSYVNSTECYIHVGSLTGTSYKANVEKNGGVWTIWYTFETKTANPPDGDKGVLAPGSGSDPVELTDAAKLYYAKTDTHTEVNTADNTTVPGGKKDVGFKFKPESLNGARITYADDSVKTLNTDKANDSDDNTLEYGTDWSIVVGDSAATAIDLPADGVFTDDNAAKYDGKKAYVKVGDVVIKEGVGVLTVKELTAETIAPTYAAGKSAKDVLNYTAGGSFDASAITGATMNFNTLTDGLNVTYTGAAYANAAAIDQTKYYYQVWDGTDYTAIKTDDQVGGTGTPVAEDGDILYICYKDINNHEVRSPIGTIRTTANTNATVTITNKSTNKPLATDASYGDLLEAVVDGAADGAKLTYQWQSWNDTTKKWVDIEDANGNYYTAAKTDVDNANPEKNLRVVVTEVGKGGDAKSSNDTITAPVTRAASDQKTQGVNVTKKTLTVDFTAEDKPYDGSDAATVHPGALSGVIGSDAVSIKTGYSGAFGNAATVNTDQTVTLDNVMLEGNDQDYYDLEIPQNPQAKITKLAVSWGDLVFTVGKTKRYDSTKTVYAKDNASATAANANAVGAQSIGGTVDGVTVVDWSSSSSHLTDAQKTALVNSGLKFSFAFESENALGSGASKIIVTANVPAGSDTFDFSGLTTTTIYGCTVNPKEITVGVGDLTAPSTTKDGSPYVTITGTVNDARTEGSDSFTFTVLGLFESTAESGSKKVTVQGVTATSSDGITWTNKNYIPKWTDTTETTGTVTGGEVTDITVNTAPTGTYGNAYSTATGLKIDVYFDDDTTTPMTCTSFSELENLGVKTIVEDKKSGTEYYFATDPSKTIGWSGTGISATLNLKFYKAAADDTKTAEQAWNNPGTVTKDSTLTVSPRPITATAEWKITEGSDEYTAKYYDGMANATGSLWPSGTAKDTTGTGAATVTVTPLTGDTVTATYTGAAFQTAGVGTGKTINVTGISLGGANANRYTLANTTATATGDIVARPITVTFTKPSVVVKSDETIYKTQEFNGTNGEKLDVSATLTFDETNTVGEHTGKVTVSDQIWNDPNYAVTVKTPIDGTVTAKAISNVIVTYDQPEKGKMTTEDGFVSPTGFNNIAEITRESTDWKQGNDLNASDGVTGDTFAAGQKYVVTTVVKANFSDGYVFDNNTVFNLSGGSVKATGTETTMSVTLSDNGKTATVKELLTVPADSTIAHVVGGIPEPTPGTSTGTNGSTSSVITTKGTSVTPADGLTNAAPAVTWFVENDGGTGWDSFTGTFDYGKQYKAEITYTAKTGYSFAGDVDFVINNIGPVTAGNTVGTGVTLAAAKTGDAYKLTIVFPKAGSQNLTNVVVNTILPPMHGDTVPSVWINKGEPYEGVTNTLKWQVSDNGTSGWNDVAAGTSFEAGKYYRVTGQVQLTETEKYDITTSTKFYMGDIEIPQAGVETTDYKGTFTATDSAKGDGSYDDETKYTLTLTYKAALTDNTDKSVIRVAANVLQPVAEQKPATAVSVTVAQNKLGESMLDGVTANDLKWYDVADDTTPLAADATFAKDATYKAVFTLSADTANAYSFLSADPDYVDFLVNNVLKDGNWINGADTAEHGEGDGKITVTTVKKNDNSYEVTVIFPKTAEKADILTVWATADVPTAGTKAQDAAMNVADSEPYEIVENGIKWFEKGQADPLGATDTFTAGKTYTAQITVKLKDSATAYTFTEDTEGYINDTTKDTAEYDGTAETVTVTRDFTVELASTGPVLLTVTDPVSGGDPTAAAYDAAKVDASAKFDIVTDHGWTKADGSAVGSTFEAGQTYKVTVDVKAQEGYKLPEALSSYYMNSIPGAGSASSNVYVKALTGDDAGKYQVVYTYAIPATSQANQVGVAVTRPVTGETAQSAKPSDPDKYEIVDTKWTGGGKTDAEPGFKFAEKTAYTVKVTVQGKDGVTIKPGDTFYFNGEQIAADKVKDLGGGKYEMTHTFPATAADSTGTDTPTPPIITPPGGTTTIEKEKPVVTYWISEKGVTNDLTAEKVEEGGKPSFTPKVTAKEEGYVFAGWSESDPTKVKDPKLVNPLTYTITADKTFYAVYKEDKPEVAKHEHYVKGYPGGVFVPDGSISRGEVAAIIARSCLAGYVEGANYGNAGYTDLEGHWAKSAIVFCTLSGILTGYGDGTFRPDAPISRQEFAVAFARMAGIQTSKGLTFTDAADIADWAEDGVYTCKANGWIEGYADGSFRPWQNITRAESVKIMNAFLHRGVNEAGLSELKGDYKTWPDVPKTHWAYYEILEAANDHDYYYVDPDKAVPPEHWTDAYVGEVSWGG